MIIFFCVSSVLIGLSGVYAVINAVLTVRRRESKSKIQNGIAENLVRSETLQLNPLEVKLLIDALDCFGQHNAMPELDKIQFYVLKGELKQLKQPILKSF